MLSATVYYSLSLHYFIQYPGKYWKALAFPIYFTMHTILQSILNPLVALKNKAGVNTQESVHKKYLVKEIRNTDQGSKMNV